MVNQGYESAGAFGSHVNLLATVSLKTDYHLCEQIVNKETGKLYESILKQFKTQKSIRIIENAKKPKLIP